MVLSLLSDRNIEFGIKMLFCKRLFLVGFFALCLPAFLTGCRAHVALGPLPSETAPVAERVEAYKKYAPQAQRNIILFSDYAAAATVDSLMLGNGQRVDHPKDLVQLVGTDTKLAEYVKSAESKNLLANTFLLGSLALMAVGSGMIIADATAADRAFEKSRNNWWNNGGPFPTSPGLSGTSVAGFGVLGLGLVGVGVGFYFGWDSVRDRNSAFDVYDGELLRRLKLEKGKF